MCKQIFKYIISSGLFIFMCTLASAQIHFDIDELRIYQYNLGEKYNEFNEDHWTGPTISFTGTLTNTSEYPIILNAIRDSIILRFNYRNENYHTYEVSFFLGEDVSRPLKQGEVLPIWFTSHIFLGSSITKHPSSDFRELLLQVLPTLQVQYYIRELGLYIETTKFNHVQLVQ